MHHCLQPGTHLYRWVKWSNVEWKLAQGFNTVLTQDSNPGSLSRESKALPPEKLRSTKWVNIEHTPSIDLEVTVLWLIDEEVFPEDILHADSLFLCLLLGLLQHHTRGLPRLTGWQLNGPIITAMLWLQNRYGNWSLYIYMIQHRKGILCLTT